MPIVLYFLGAVVLISGLAWVATIFGAANTAVTPVAMMLLAGAVVAASLAARSGRRR